MSHVTHMNESYHTYEWVMSHTWKSHVTHMNESCPISEWVRSRINESCHTHTHAHTHTQEALFSHHNGIIHLLFKRALYTFQKALYTLKRALYTPKRALYTLKRALYTSLDQTISKLFSTHISHIWHMDESCHTYEWVISRILMGHVIHVNELCHA